MLISVTMPVERSTAMFLFASKGRSKVCAPIPPRLGSEKSTFECVLS